MESFPGAFPDLYATSNQNEPISSRRAEFDNEQSLNDTVNLRKALKSRKSSFKADMLMNFECLCYVYVLISYLYDCSLLLLVIRSILPPVMLIQTHIPGLEVLNTKITSKRSIICVFYGILLTNTVAILIHLLRDLPTPNEDGYVYGHQTLQMIGQKQLDNKNWIFVIDGVIFMTQMIIFSCSFYTEKDRSLKLAILLENEYDGWQGRTIAIKIPFLKALLPPFITVEQLKTEQDELERSQTDALVNDTIPGGYGSNNNENTGSDHENREDTAVIRGFSF